MAKIYGLFGAMTGKVADVVMVVRNGVQLARKYQPIVSNPSSPAQVAARAKLKLLSQLAAVMAPVVAFNREGIVSARNRFVSANYPSAVFANGEADLNLSAVKLTQSVVGFRSLSAVRDLNSVSASVQRATGFDRVFFCCFLKQADNTLRFAGSASVEVAADGSAQTTFELGTQMAVVLYAYGVRFNSDAARAAYGDMKVEQVEDIVSLLTSRGLTESDYTLSETVFTSLPAGA